MHRQAPKSPSESISPLVSIIIVNLDGRHWLEQCLPTLQAQTFQDFETVVVDNGSADDSVRWLRENWPGVRIIVANRNLGFARANNIAIRETSSKYVVALNNDTLVDPDWLHQLVAAVQSSDETGMAASHIVIWNHTEILDSTGIEVDQTGLAWNRGWGLSSNHAAFPADVFGPSGAAALYRRQMLEEIGLFDEDFFMYYEDVDLAWRAQRAGWKCRYAAGATVRHWHSASAQKDPGFKVFLLSRNKIWTILKNYAWPNLFWQMPKIVLYDLLAILYQITQKRALSALRGRSSALLSARKMIVKRPPHGRNVTLAPAVAPWRMIRDRVRSRPTD